MRPLHKQLKILKHKLPKQNTIYNTYRFIPQNREVYYEVNNEKKYLDYDEVINDEYEIAETLLWLPDYNENKDPIPDTGSYVVCVGGANVVNENN